MPHRADDAGSDYRADSSLTTQTGFYVFLSLGSAKGYDLKVTIDWIEQE
jgi:hypothetical protein